MNSRVLPEAAAGEEVGENAETFSSLRRGFKRVACREEVPLVTGEDEVAC